jgi:DNA-binding NarL/FixJ family response regulator
MDNKIRVLVADDHAVLRAGLRILINSRPDMEVCAEAADGREAVLRAAELRPDVAVMDLSMPTMGGVQAIERMRQVSPSTHVLVFSMHQDTAYARSALAAGASGYVTKRAVEDELLAGIRAVHQGRTWIDSLLAKELRPEAAPPPEDAPPEAAPQTGSPPSRLSRRERQVLELLVQGYGNQQVADRLFLSKKTVETYHTRLSRKLGLQSRADFVRYGLETRLLSPGQIVPEVD